MKDYTIILMNFNKGSLSIGVLSGMGTENQLKRAGVDLLFNDILEFAKYAIENEL